MADRDITKEEREILEACKAKYQDVAPFRLKDGTFTIVRKCTPMERTRTLTDMSGKNKSDGVAGPHKTLARSVIVHPSAQEDIDALLVKYPVFADTAATRAFDLAEGDAVELGND